MKKKEIKCILDELYPAPPIPLKHCDPYTLLIAVLLSAQCTDARVNIVTPHLFKRADIPEKMVLLDVSEIQSIIRCLINIIWLIIKIKLFSLLQLLKQLLLLIV